MPTLLRTMTSEVVSNDEPGGYLEAKAILVS